MIELIPAILSKDRADAEAKLRLVEGSVEWIQLDVMDGHFVPNTTWFDAEAWTSFDSNVKVELHLMVSDPRSVIQAWSKVPTCGRAIWHVEIPVDHEQLIEQCRQLGWECGLAISPDTLVERVRPYLDRIDEVLVLGVQPGFSGQSLIAATLEKVRALKTLKPTLKVGFDGGVTRENIGSILATGCNRVNVASSIFGAGEPKQALTELRDVVESEEYGS